MAGTDVSVHAVVGVNITVGNEAVQQTEDVAQLLAQLSEALFREGRSLRDIADGPSVRMWDRNGNTVGFLQVTGYSEEPAE